MNGLSFKLSGDLRLLRFLTVITVVTTFFLVALGGAVRVTDSGLACPDWPLCYGQVIPPFDFHVILEYSHRLAASVVSALVLVVAVLTGLFHRREKWLVVPAMVSVVLLGAQVGLGAITVLYELPPMIVLAHLAMAEMLVALMVFMCVLVWFNRAKVAMLRKANSSECMRIFPFLLVCVLALYLLLLSGSYVTVSEASWACGNQWPLCYGGLIPDDTSAAVHMGHRWLALVVAGLLFGFFCWVWKRRAENVATFRAASVAVILYLAQAAVGAFTVWLDFSQDMRLLHLVMATLTWISVVTLTTLVFMSAKYQSIVWEE